MHSFNILAGVSDGIRYLFPIIILFYSYAIKDRFPVLLKFVLLFVLLNFLVQIVNYVNWINGEEQWFYYKRDGYTFYNNVSGIIRGTGIVVFFGFFGFLNLISYVIINTFYTGKFKKILLTIAVFGVFSSISYKTIGTFLLILFLNYHKYILKTVLIFLITVLTTLIFFREQFMEFLNSLYQRINIYILGSKSARSESYRVMMEEISDFNFFGEGIGVFGGPASIIYDSPFYDEKNFNWYDAEWLNLITTDTFYPHLFVELGILGGLIYLFVLFMPLMSRKITKAWITVGVIYFALFFDAFFSFALNNPEFLMFSIVFAYPILNYYESKKN